MFNFSKVETKVCPVTQVIEKTITPDKVVEMYDHTEKVAITNIAKKHLFNENILKGVVIQRAIEGFEGTSIFHVSFILNGQQFTETVKIIATESAMIRSRADARILLANRMAEAVARKVIASISVENLCAK